MFSVLVAFAATAPTTAPAQSKIYWADPELGHIQRANLDGSGLENVVSVRLDEPSSLELDLTNGKLYWSAAGEIGQANLDGSQVERAVTLESDGFFTPISRGVSVDETAGKIYWIEDDRIHRSNLDGSEREELITAGVVDSEGLEVDPAGGKVYWTNSEFSGGVIRRANLDGTDVEDLVADGFQPQKIELDGDAGKIYWTDFISNDVFRANLDGSSVEEIVTDQDNPDGIALDLVNAKVYWVDLTEDAVRRANLDGSGVEDLPIVVERPIDVAVDAAAGNLYVVVEDGELYRSNLDGTDPELLITPVGGGFESLAIDGAAQKLYWGSREGAQRSDLNGDNVENVVPGSVGEVELNPESGKIYWAQFDGIYRADLDGSNPELLAASDSPFNLTLDLRRGKMYWTGDGNPTTADKIRTGNLDGSDAGVFLDDLDVPNRLNLDVDGGTLFWTEGGFNFGTVIRRAGVDGSGVADIVEEQIDGSIALDPDNAKIYWSGRRIKRANLDGSNVEELHSADFTVSWLTLDPTGGKMYWVTEERIERADLDGSNVETVASDLGRPENLVLNVSTATSIEDEVLPVGHEFQLGGAYPNPFRSRATIMLEVDRPQSVEVSLFNALGQRVDVLHSGWLSAGSTHEFSIDAADMPGGAYFYRVEGESFRATETVILVK